MMKQGVLGLGVLFIVYSGLGWDTIRVVNVISGFSLGASSLVVASPSPDRRYLQRSASSQGSPTRAPRRLS